MNTRYTSIVNYRCRYDTVVGLTRADAGQSSNLASCDIVTTVKRTAPKPIQCRIRAVTALHTHRNRPATRSNPHRPRIPITDTHPFRGFLPWGSSVACF